jgi:hypothetical protein
MKTNEPPPSPRVSAGVVNNPDDPNGPALLIAIGEPLESAIYLPMSSIAGLKRVGFGPNTWVVTR